jgi:hypothetical protein
MSDRLFVKINRKMLKRLRIRADVAPAAPRDPPPMAMTAHVSATRLRGTRFSELAVLKGLPLAFTLHCHFPRDPSRGDPSWGVPGKVPGIFPRGITVLSPGSGIVWGEKSPGLDKICPGRGIPRRKGVPGSGTEPEPLYIRLNSENWLPYLFATWLPALSGRPLS